MCSSIFILCSTANSNYANGDGEQTPPVGSDTFGYIKDDDGNPLQGVVVSDGFSCTTTDASGQYALTRDAHADFIYYSLPSGYRVDMHKTYKLPRFYSKLTAGTARYDFTLTPLDSPETRFDLIVIGDPQVGDAAQVARFKEETAKDIREYVASSDVPCYGMALGDLVANKWELFGSIATGLQPELTGLPVFSTIGNHDHQYVRQDDKASRAMYESFFGPVNYSINRGDVHIISMDDILHSAKASAEYEGGFTAEQFEWLKQDLSFVPESKMVILCVHIPYRNNGDYPYWNEVLELLSRYSYATIMSAHTHSNINYIYPVGSKQIFEHVTGTSCGAWWRSTVCTEGTPIGYGIYRIEGAEMKEWVYKSVRHDEDFQIRLYRASDTFTGGNASFTFSQKGDDRIIANIWNWDEGWTVNVYENGTKTGTMTRYTDKDAWVGACHVDALGASENHYKSTSHLFHYALVDSDAEVMVEAIDRFGNVYRQTHFTDPDSTPLTFNSDF
jgi:hypothetical protein